MRQIMGAQPIPMRVAIGKNLTSNLETITAMADQCPTQWLS
jgi:hypothetical protein